MDLGTVEGVTVEIRHLLHALDRALSFTATAGNAYREAKRVRILAYARALGDAIPEDEKKLKAAAPRKLEAKRLTATQEATEADAQMAWELANAARRTIEAQLNAVQTVAAMAIVAKRVTNQQRL